jgi:hypothetical protein
MFVTREDGNLELLIRGPAPRHPASVYGTTSYYSADPSLSGGAYIGLNPHVGPNYLSTMTPQGPPIEKTIFQFLARTLSSSSLGATPDRDSIKDYPEIRGSAYLNPTIEARRIRTAPAGTRPSRDLNPNFNVVRL